MSGQGSIRIIAGRWRRSRLNVPRRPGLRPTPDRVRETLFNWLMPDIHGARCLDLFAGTGALGFEAASRGAADVVLVEHDLAAANALEENRRRLAASQIRVEHCDAQTFMDGGAGAFDIVFLDPPFGAYDLRGLCVSLQHHALLKPGSKIYLESDASSALPLVPEGWELLRSGRAARVRYDLACPGRFADTPYSKASCG